MKNIRIDNLSKSYGQTAVIEGLNLRIDEGEFVVLVGPSGCGKSTLLRVIAGLKAVTGGDIRIGDRVVTALDPKDRVRIRVGETLSLSVSPDALWLSEPATGFRYGRATGNGPH